MNITTAMAGTDHATKGSTSEAAKRTLITCSRRRGSSARCPPAISPPARLPADQAARQTLPSDRPPCPSANAGIATSTAPNARP